jgi:hypothetical protein
MRTHLKIHFLVILQAVSSLQNCLDLWAFLINRLLQAEHVDGRASKVCRGRTQSSTLLEGVRLVSAVS